MYNFHKGMNCLPLPEAVVEWFLLWRYYCYLCSSSNFHYIQDRI